MTYYTNTHGLYYNSQFNLDKVIQEISKIRDLQDELKGNLIKLKQIYDSDDQQEKSIALLNN
jgi:hypothetical protein